MNANIAQITVRAKGDDLAIRTFPLSEAVAAKMQQIVDKGGYQYGDKVTVLYDAASQKAIKIKGKPSKSL
jgi:ribosomal protein L18